MRGLYFFLAWRPKTIILLSNSLCSCSVKCLKEANSFRTWVLFLWKERHRGCLSCKWCEKATFSRWEIKKQSQAGAMFVTRSLQVQNGLIKCVIEQGVPAVHIHRGHIYMRLAEGRGSVCRDPEQLWTLCWESCCPPTVHHRAAGVVWKGLKVCFGIPAKHLIPGHKLFGRVKLGHQPAASVVFGQGSCIFFPMARLSDFVVEDIWCSLCLL